jgi:hypothetical protein
MDDNKILDEIMREMNEDPWYVKFKRSFKVWWSFEISNRIAWFRIRLHRKQLKNITCEKCDYFVPFMCYVDKGDCMHPKIWKIVKIWKKPCQYFKEIEK